jgi:hypothetical protein
MRTWNPRRLPFYLAGGLAITMVVAGAIGLTYGIFGGGVLGAVTSISSLVLGPFLYEGTYRLLLLFERLPDETTPLHLTIRSIGNGG